MVYRTPQKQIQKRCPLRARKSNWIWLSCGRPFVRAYRAMMMTPHVATASLCSIQMREPTKAAGRASKFHVISKINTICILDCLARSAGAVLASIKANKAAAVAELEWETSKHTASSVFAQLWFCTAVQIRAQPLLGDLRPALIPIADSIIDTEYIPSGVFSNSAAHLVGWQRPAEFRTMH